MRYILLATLAFFVVSCQSPQRQAAVQQSDRQYCGSINATGPQFSQCMIYRDQARRQESAARWQRFNAANAQLQATIAAQTPAPRVPVTTNCFNVGGGQIQCRTF